MRLEEAPVKTLYVKTQRRAQKVRAVLHANGTGSVRLASSSLDVRIFSGGITETLGLQLPSENSLG